MSTLSIIFIHSACKQPKSKTNLFANDKMVYGRLKNIQLMMYRITICACNDQVQDQFTIVADF